MRLPFRIFSACAATLLTAGCATTTGSVDISDPQSGFTTVAMRSRAATGKTPVWVQSNAQAQALAEQVGRLVKSGPVGPDMAVQVALLNNKGLQAAYADIGLSAADVWQESLLVNPRVSVGIMTLDAVRTVEAAVVSNILALMTRVKRVAVADARFRQAQLRAAEETMRLAADTRRAWVNAVAAQETVGLLGQAQVSADAAAELARKLGETGAFSKTGQAREFVFNAELAGEAAQARLDARQTREELTRLMGLWGQDIAYKLPVRLPGLPKGVYGRSAIEREALQQRVDLEIARLELEALAREYKLTEATRYLTDLELLTGVEVEREEEEDGETKNVATPRIEVEFVIPVFDTGKPRMRKAELAYMQAANRLAEKAVNVRSQARSAFDAYRSTYDIARHYRNSVVPLRKKIEEESVLTYNGMITNTFELLADTRARIEANIQALRARQSFWIADVNLGTAVHGGGAAASSETVTASAADGDGAGH
ncbi:copper resistance protein [Mesorhizobium amorphae]|uniref:Copper tolerance protein n=1 Tax=Mesorhizobium amorphae CCNWGS0123 TaxID=1082933 RepID=G6YKI8_9HYPH|nr:Copper tolerance protein [Mesorhizobium amorphae CCNWGS0123]GLR42339.1 copper resistance protein [Mesorhizobium amorphae]